MNPNDHEDTVSAHARLAIHSIVGHALGNAILAMENMRVPPDIATREITSFMTMTAIKTHHATGMPRAAIAAYFRLIGEGLANGSCPIPGDTTPPPEPKAAPAILPDDPLEVQKILIDDMREPILAAMRQCGDIASERTATPLQRAGAWCAITQAAMEGLFTLLTFQGLSKEQCAQSIYAFADHLAAPAPTPGPRPTGPGASQ